MACNFSCTDFTFPLLSHGNALKLISMLGIGSVDIGFLQDRSHIQPSRVAADPLGEGKKLRKDLEREGLAAADVFLQSAADFSSLALNQIREGARKKAREDFLCALQFAEGCGSNHITCLPGVFFPEEAGDASLERARSELAWRVEQAAAHGIILGIEAHRGSIADTPARAKALVESVPGLTLTLDYSHFIRGGFSQAEITPLLAYARHFHARGSSPQMMQTPLKESSIDFVRVVKDMKAAGYRDVITLEYVYENWEDNFRVDTLSETILLKELIESAWRDA
ncbi:MAG: sugar phosphate isomerase/epimerase [Treponema sp.]|jgi:sugar phosphate isomerase/epimerase|nr:sugar phosphate isomerase/epimerase [Treponema sp.]